MLHSPMATWNQTAEARQAVAAGQEAETEAPTLIAAMRELRQLREEREQERLELQELRQNRRMEQ
ncbi:hypothetical protein EAI_04276 [Harpegnathos saltator]|uniref:Uncharacterized protein n=1 Tax=Harpegnathos saltator TaxID=610380 RepID=E2C277_HARSA|nr:hypothetical protein EAI_04276 [Harpegnathos saltator]